MFAHGARVRQISTNKIGKIATSDTEERADYDVMFDGENAEVNVPTTDLEAHVDGDDYGGAEDKDDDAAKSDGDEAKG